MTMLDGLCLYKKHWFISWLIVVIILSIIYNLTELDIKTQYVISSVYLVLHIIIVVFVKTNDCKKLKIKQEKERAELILGVK